MGFLGSLLNRSIHAMSRTVKKPSKKLSLESLEQRIALDASTLTRPQLEPTRTVHIGEGFGPSPIEFEKSQLIGHDTKSFIVKSVVTGSTVEKWDASANQWQNISAVPQTSSPRALLQFFRNRLIQTNDKLRWTREATDGQSQKVFEIIGWDDGSEASEPEGVNVPGPVENLAMNIVGDEVQVTWDPPTSGAAVTHYRIHQNPTTVVPSTQTSHTFAKARSPASYAVTIHANSAEGAGEATTVTFSHGSYVKTDGTVVDPILDTSGHVLDYDGPNLKPGVYLDPGPNLDNADLNHADLSHATFVQGSFVHANLSNAKLSSIDLQSSDMTGANLTNANLDIAHIDDVKLDNASLNGVWSGRADGGGGNVLGYPASLPSGWMQRKGLLIGPNVDLSNTKLSGEDLSNANLSGVNVTNAEIDGVTLSGIRSGGVTGTPASLPAHWQITSGYFLGPEVNLDSADLTNVDLGHADLTNAKLYDTVLTNTDLSNATLTGVQSDNLTTVPAALPPDWQIKRFHLIGPGANLTNANLEGVLLTNSDLTHTILTGANLSDVFLTDTNLTGANLSHANVANTWFTNATLTGVKSGGIVERPAALPTGWKLEQGYLIGPGADLTNAALGGLDLTGMDLTNTNLANSNLDGVNLTNATLTGVQSGGITGTPHALPAHWQLIDGFLIGPGANLADSNLNNTDLVGANLTNADLANVNLNGVNLMNATLTGVQSGGITGTPSHLPTDWQLTSGYLIGPGANLAHANLNGVNLSNATLTGVESGGITGTPSHLPTGWQLFNGYLVGPGANLTNANLTSIHLANMSLANTNLNGVDLTGATLTGVQSGGITGTPHALPAHWQLTSGYLIGPGADLASATLSNANLTNAYLANTNLAGADLTGATLFGVQSGGITGTPHALPTAGPHGNAQWQLIDGYLIGPGADLTGASLTDSNLNNTDLVGANLTNAQLYGVHLANADLYNATLTGVQSGDITGTPLHLPTNWQLTTNGYLIGSSANLINADLSNVDLNNADLSNATLTRVRSGGITGVPYALPTNWQLTNGYLIGPGADLTGAILSSANLTNAHFTNTNLAGADLTDATLTGVYSGGIAGTPVALPSDWQLHGAENDRWLIGPGANLTNANLPNVNLANMNLSNTNLTNTILSNATLSGVQSGGITGTPASLPSDWQLTDGYLIGTHANLTGAPLLYADLQGAQLQFANLTHANLQSANLTHANLSEAVLDHTHLWYVHLAHADLTDAELTDVSLLGADLTSATLSGVKLNGEVYFTNTQLSGVKSGGIDGSASMLPANWQLNGGYLIGPGADLTNADLSNLDLNGVDLSNAILTGVQSGGITGTPSHLPANWQLIDGYLIGPHANLTSANLTGVVVPAGSNLTHADLSGAIMSFATLVSVHFDNAILTGVDLNGADLANATLTGIQSGGIIGTPSALPHNWKLINGYLVGPGADLSNADLANADLNNADLNNADLSNATLTGVQSGGITGTPSHLPANWQLIDGYLIGPHANLTSANLTGVVVPAGSNLTHADLSGAIMSFATLVSVHFDNAILTGVDLNGADLANATLTGIQSGGIIGTPSALPHNWKLINGYLVGPGADLTGANLTGANLTNAYFTNADLTGVTLTGVTGAAKYNLATILPPGFDPHAAGWQLVS